jgi:hypothetical protein
MAGILNFANYIGGADNLQIEQAFPSDQKTFVYNFGQDITDWIFHLDYQTVVANSITFDRNTGEPNFASSTIIGSFPSGIINTGTYVTVTDAVEGIVSITIPSGLYSGPIIPDARSHTPITIIGVTWEVPSTPPQISTHRWALIQSWEPGVPPGDPVLDADYTAIAIGG